MDEANDKTDRIFTKVIVYHLSTQFLCVMNWINNTHNELYTK